MRIFCRNCIQAHTPPCTCEKWPMLKLMLQQDNRVGIRADILPKLYPGSHTSLYLREMAYAEVNVTTG